MSTKTNIKGKTNKNNNKNYGSSSSDEADHINERCSGGWPSTVSVLETPDRKRVRNSLRSNNKQNICSINLIPEISFPSTIITTHLSFASTSTVINTLANSPPTCRLSNSFCSPTLRTPRQSITTTIHLSGSPLRSFFIKENQLQISPNCCSSSSSTTISNRGDSALRPLNLQNYIGVRFNGEKSEQIQNQQKPIILQSSSNNLQLERKIIDENLENDEKQNKSSDQQRRVSKDSGFSEINSNETKSNNDKSSSSHLSSFVQSGFIETPSKGLSSVQPLFHSTPLHSPPPLLLFDSTNNYPSTSSFHSPIPEQSYGGPFESSIFDDILNDLDKIQPEIYSKQQTPKKYQNQNRSVKFERRLLSLKWRRESPRKKANSLLEWQKIEQNNFPSNLFIEGINNENLKEISVLFSQNDCQLMFGKTTDQLEITEKAKKFLNIIIPNNSKMRKTKSAGLISQLKEERIIKL